MESPEPRQSVDVSALRPVRHAEACGEDLEITEEKQLNVASTKAIERSEDSELRSGYAQTEVMRSSTRPEGACPTNLLI
jgi:hypothetical protein